MISKLRRVRGTPHPLEFVAPFEMPSPARGEGALTGTAFATRASTLPLRGRDDPHPLSLTHLMMCCATATSVPSCFTTLMSARDWRFTGSISVMV